MHAVLAAAHHPFPRLGLHVAGRLPPVPTLCQRYRKSTSDVSHPGTRSPHLSASIKALCHGHCETPLSRGPPGCAPGRPAAAAQPVQLDARALVAPGPGRGGHDAGRAARRPPALPGPGAACATGALLVQGGLGGLAACCVAEGKLCACSASAVGSGVAQLLRRNPRHSEAFSEPLTVPRATRATRSPPASPMAPPSRAPPLLALRRDLGAARAQDAGPLLDAGRAAALLLRRAAHRRQQPPHRHAVRARASMPRPWLLAQASSRPCLSGVVHEQRAS